MYLLFVGPPLLLAMLAQWWVKSAYRKGLQVPTPRRLTGQQAAQDMMRYAGLGLKTQVVGGELTDKYDPRNDTLYLSQGVANSPSVGAMAIVAHELGHALQDEEQYAPMMVRSALVAPVNFSSNAAVVLFFIGAGLSYIGLYSAGQVVSWIGIFGFCLAVLFHLVTLPVELNASRRGLRLLDEMELVGEGQMGIARNVLNAAALTYIAALAQSLATVMYYVFRLSRGRSRRRR
jgi:Zn-dependent membrane protease YugP